MMPVTGGVIRAVTRNKLRQMRDLLFFCPERVAIIGVSGIITTNLGKTATHTKVRRAQKTDTSLQNMPFFLTGERHFFLASSFATYMS